MYQKPQKYRHLWILDTKQWSLLCEHAWTTYELHGLGLAMRPPRPYTGLVWDETHLYIKGRICRGIVPVLVSGQVACHRLCCKVCVQIDLPKHHVIYFLCNIFYGFLMTSILLPEGKLWWRGNCTTDLFSLYHKRLAADSGTNSWLKSHIQCSMIKVICSFE